MDERDQELIDRARAIIRGAFHNTRHKVGSAVRMRSGKVYTAVNLDTHVGRIAVCAEAVALGKAVSEGEDEIETIVAVLQKNAEDKTPMLASPCGMCREMISDYGPNSKVIVQTDNGPETLSIAELLPLKFRNPTRK